MAGISVFDTQEEFDTWNPAAKGRLGVADANGFSLVSKGTQGGDADFLGTFVHEMYHNFQSAVYEPGSDQSVFKSEVSKEIKDFMTPNQYTDSKGNRETTMPGTMGPQENQAQRMVRTVRNEAAQSGFFTPSRDLPSSSDRYDNIPVPGISPKAPIKRL